jgi:catechol 2,3-dioxygenase-like lactoylglutathione lyase family enzyme
MNAQSGTAAGAEPFSIKRIDHTGFTVSSLEDSLAFWVDALGFWHLYTWTFETHRGDGRVPGAALRLAMVEGAGPRGAPERVRATHRAAFQNGAA